MVGKKRNLKREHNFSFPTALKALMKFTHRDDQPEELRGEGISIWVTILTLRKLIIHSASVGLPDGDYSPPMSTDSAVNLLAIYIDSIPAESAEDLLKKQQAVDAISAVQHAFLQILDAIDTREVPLGEEVK